MRVEGTLCKSQILPRHREISRTADILSGRGDLPSAYNVDVQIWACNYRLDSNLNTLRDRRVLLEGPISCWND